MYPQNEGHRVFDAHVHVEDGLEGYDLIVSGKNVIYNYLESYRKFRERYHSKADTIALILDAGHDFDFVRGEAEHGRIHALKIHSRVGRLTADDWRTITRRLEMLPAHLPVIVDAFYFGRELQFQPSLAAIIDVLSKFPERNVVVAHSGGFRMLEYFFHLREFSNCYYELALSLQYLEDSSVLPDLKKLVKYTDKSKIIYGSDFPFASPHRQYRIFLEICRELKIAEADVDRMLYANAAKLFKNKK